MNGKKKVFGSSVVEAAWWKNVFTRMWTYIFANFNFCDSTRFFRLGEGGMQFPPFHRKPKILHVYLYMPTYAHTNISKGWLNLEKKKKKPATPRYCAKCEERLKKYLGRFWNCQQ